MSTVYIVQDSPGKNFLPAKNYGELRVLLSPHDTELGINDIAEKLHQKLSSIKSDDYLLLVGDPAIIGIVSAIALDLTDGCLNLLRWNRSRYEYIVERVEEIWQK